jgi:hypothetical protein
MSHKRLKSTEPSRRLQSTRRFSRLHLTVIICLFAVIGTVLITRSLAYRTVGISNGSIYAFCQFSHRANDDPIVFPGKSGAAHSHDFFGATNLNAFSTNDSIRHEPTSCHRPKDTSAYWVPTMYVDGQVVDAHSMTAVYGNDHQLLKNIQPYPEGLRMIAGTSSGGSPMTPNRAEPIFGWLCRFSEVVVPATLTSAPTCSDTDLTKYNQREYLQLIIRFPSCWDGVNLDSPDHKSHMAYAYQQHGATPEFPNGMPANSCPSTHPVQLPDLNFDIAYYTTGGPTARLSSGDMSTIHADFMNGWNQTELTTLVNLCLKRDNYCGGGDFPVDPHNNEPDDVDSLEVLNYLKSIGEVPAPAPATPPAGTRPPLDAASRPDNWRPTTSITAPLQNSTVSGSVNITATGEDFGPDNINTPGPPTKVELYIDDVLASTDVAAPYSFSWDTASYSQGKHTLTTKAYDAAGNVSSSVPVTVTVGSTEQKGSNATSSQLKRGDVNGDGKVDIFDVALLAKNWKKTGALRAEGDLNGDGIVNIFDVAIVASGWEKK